MTPPESQPPGIRTSVSSAHAPTPVPTSPPAPRDKGAQREPGRPHPRTLKLPCLRSPTLPKARPQGQPATPCRLRGAQSTLTWPGAWPEPPAFPPSPRPSRPPRAPGHSSVAGGEAQDSGKEGTPDRAAPRGRASPSAPLTHPRAGGLLLVPPHTGRGVTATPPQYSQNKPRPWETPGSEHPLHEPRD